jgi:hypothetical protein
MLGVVGCDVAIRRSAVFSGKPSVFFCVHPWFLAFSIT